MYLYFDQNKKLVLDEVNKPIFDNVSSNITTGLTGRWTMNEGSGTTVFDSSGYGNNGIITLGQWVSGKTGRYAVNHTGTTTPTATIVNMGNSSFYDIGASGMTLSAWFKTSAVNQPGFAAPDFYGCIWGRGYVAGGVNGGMGLFLFNNKAAVQPRDDSRGVAYSAFGTQNLNNGIWHHIVGVLIRNNSVGVRLYVDGILVDAQSSKPLGMNNLQITKYLGTSMRTSTADVFPFLGHISDTRIYNRELTDADVLALYNYEI
jgi:hypothetical protein